MLVRNNILMCLVIEIGRFFRILYVKTVHSKRYFALAVARSTMLTLTSKSCNFFYFSLHFFHLPADLIETFYVSFCSCMPCFLPCIETDSRVFGTLSTFEFLLFDAWFPSFTWSGNLMLEKKSIKIYKRKEF